MTAEGGADPRVLAVDDEKEVADAYALRLRNVADVAVAYSGGEALEAVDDESEPAPDVVLLDRHMPTLSGDEVLERLRDRPFETRVVMVTAIDPEVDILDLPFDDYLCKPVDNDDVRTVVRQQCEVLGYRLLGEYFTAASKQAVLRAERPPGGPDADPELDDRLADVEQSSERLRRRIRRLLPHVEETVEAFAGVTRKGE